MKRVNISNHKKVFINQNLFLCVMKAVIDSKDEVELEYIGEGATGTTYRGIVGEKISLVKILNASLPQDAPPERTAALVQTIEGEVDVLKRLDHPRVPKYYGSGIIELSPTDRRIYSAREFKEGQSLEQVIKDHGPLSETEATRLLIQMLELLSVLHAQSTPVIHRDIKPENIILDGSESSLIDFGVATQPFNTLIGIRTLYGTPGYMAPEQAMGKAADQRTDIYGLGATLIRCITNQHPGLLLDDTSRINFRDRVAGRYSENLLHVLEKMTQSNARERYQFAGEALADLTELPPLTKHRIGEILSEKGYSPVVIEEALSRNLTDASALGDLEKNLAQKEAEILETLREFVEFYHRTRVKSLIIPDTSTDYDAKDAIRNPTFHISLGQNDDLSGVEICLRFNYVLRKQPHENSVGFEIKYRYTKIRRRKLSTLLLTTSVDELESANATLGIFNNTNSIGIIKEPFVYAPLQRLLHGAVQFQQSGSEHQDYRFILPALLNLRTAVYGGLRQQGEALSQYKTTDR